MSYQIQRLSFGGVFDQSFRLIRDHFATLSLGFAAIYVPMQVASAMLQPTPGATPSFATIGSALGVILVVMMILPLLQLTATVAIADAYLSQPTSFASAFARGKRLYMPYLGTSMLMMLALMPLFMLLVVPGLYFTVCWMLIGPVAVVEGVFGRKGMSRSRELVRGHWGRTFGTIVLLGVLGGATSGVLSVLFGAIPVIGAVLTGLLSGVVAAYDAVVIVVLYVDLRCRHEDFDLQLLARDVAGDHGAASAQAASRKHDVAPA
jgi:hypothetical protein